MIQTAQETDNLTLALIKQHLYVDITEDDALLTAYSASSLEMVKKHTANDILETTYGNTAFEIIPIDNKLYLELNYKPGSVTITTDQSLPINIFDKTYAYAPSSTLSTTVTVSEDFYTYIDKELVIDISNMVEFNSSTIVVSIEAKTGSNPVPETINQARLLVVAGWYANREPATNLSVNVVPYGVGLLLDLESNSVI